MTSRDRAGLDLYYRHPTNESIPVPFSPAAVRALYSWTNKCGSTAVDGSNVPEGQLPCRLQYEVVIDVETLVRWKLVDSDVVGNAGWLCAAQAISAFGRPRSYFLVEAFGSSCGQFMNYNALLKCLRFPKRVAGLAWIPGSVQDRFFGEFISQVEVSRKEWSAQRERNYRKAVEELDENFAVRECALRAELEKARAEFWRAQYAEQASYSRLAELQRWRNDCRREILRLDEQHAEERWNLATMAGEVDSWAIKILYTVSWRFDFLSEEV